MAGKHPTHRGRSRRSPPPSRKPRGVAPPPRWPPGACDTQTPIENPILKAPICCPPFDLTIPHGRGAPFHPAPPQEGGSTDPAPQEETTTPLSKTLGLGRNPRKKLTNGCAALTQAPLPRCLHNKKYEKKMAKMRHVIPPSTPLGACAEVGTCAKGSHGKKDITVI